MISINDVINSDYYLDIRIKQWEKERGLVSHSDKSLYDLDNKFIESCAQRYRAHQKKQYEQEELRLLQQRIRWTDKLRQSIGGGDWFVKWRLTEINTELQRIRNRLKYLSMPKKELQSIDIATVKSVPIGNIYEVMPNGFFRENPLRVEKSPSNSFHWNKNNNTWKDFGGGDGGDNIDLVMKDKKIGFKEACDFIIKFI